MQAITISDGLIEKATILIEGGIIKAVGQNIEVPGGAEVINLKGKYVTPGFIDAHSHLAMV